MVFGTATFEALLFKGGFGRIVNITPTGRERPRVRVPLLAQKAKGGKNHPLLFGNFG